MRRFGVKLEKTQKFIDTVTMETFFLSQVSSSQKVLSKTNAAKMKKKIEQRLRKAASKMATQKGDRKKGYFKF